MRFDQRLVFFACLKCNKFFTASYSVLEMLAEKSKRKFLLKMSVVKCYKISTGKIVAKNIGAEMLPRSSQGETYRQK